MPGVDDFYTLCKIIRMICDEYSWRNGEDALCLKYKVVQIWPGLFVCKQVTVCPGHIWTTLYMNSKNMNMDGIFSDGRF